MTRPSPKRLFFPREYSDGVNTPYHRIPNSWVSFSPPGSPVPHPENSTLSEDFCRCRIDITFQKVAIPRIPCDFGRHSLFEFPNRVQTIADPRFWRSFSFDRQASQPAVEMVHSVSAQGQSSLFVRDSPDGVSFWSEPVKWRESGIALQICGLSGEADGDDHAFWGVGTVGSLPWKDEVRAVEETRRRVQSHSWMRIPVSWYPNLHPRP